MNRCAAIALGLLFSAACSSLFDSSAQSDVRTRPVDPGNKNHAPVRNAAGTTVEYFGGPVIPNAKVYVVWWGNPANLNPAITAATGGIADFYRGVLNSSFVDWLNEYNTTINAQAGSHAGQPGTNQRIGRGNYAGTVTLSNIPSGNVTDAQVQSALNAAFSAGTLPPPDENSIYAIYFPSSVTITASDGSTSCVAYGAYHDAIVETTLHNAYYLIMPDCGDSFSGTTNVSSHELVEAITDGQPTPGSNPNYPQAWNDSSGSEVGDLCQSSSGTVSTPNGTFTVQGIWDERSQGCKTFTSAANDFNVSVSPNVATVAQGANQTFTVQSASVAGAAQALTLSVTAPAGVTASISPTAITAGQTATLTVNASSSAARSGLQVVVRADAGSGTAVQTHTAALLLSVSGAAGNDFSIAAAPASLSFTQGTAGSATSTISTAVVSGSAGAVNLTASVSPAGPTASLSSGSITAGGSATLTVTSGASVAAGNYTVTVTGSEGSATHATTVSVAVSSSSGGGGLVNGGFEAGSLSGWTATGASETAVNSGCHGGTWCARLGNTTATNGDSSITQTFTAPAGSSALTVWYKETCPDTITYDWALATLKDNTSGTTATVIAKACATNAWTSATSAVTAGHSYTLTLTSHDDNYSGDPTYTLFDDVALNGGSGGSDFSLSASPSSLSIPVGSSASATIATAVTAGSAQTIALGVTGAPSGVTATLSPTSISAGQSATLNISTTASAAAGTYTLTVTGTAASGSHSAAVTFTITVGSGGGGIANGGFESGATGWTTAGTTSIATSGCHGGASCAQAGATSPTNGDSSYAQTFTVPSGKSQLSLWYSSHCPDTVTYDWVTITLTNNSTGATSTLLGHTCASSASWTNLTAAVSAGVSYTLKLVSHDDNYASDPTYTLFDDVTLN